MNIYEIDAQIMSLVNEDGEISDIDAFAELQMEREKKIENVALWIKNLEAEAKAIKEEAKTLTERAKANEKKSESLRGYLDYALQGSKFSTSRVAISYRKSSKLELSEELTDKILNASKRSKLYKWQRVKTSVEIDKTALTEALKSGETISGAELVENSNMQIK